jgi:hypothetical protein
LLTVPPSVRSRPAKPIFKYLQYGSAPAEASARRPGGQVKI